MTPQHSPQPPSLSDLMGRYLASKNSSTNTLQDLREVEPYDNGSGFRTPALTTWNEAQAVFKLLDLNAESVAPPPEWAAFAAMDHRVAVTPLAAGLFPQRSQAVPHSVPTSTDWLSDQVPGFSGLRAWVRSAMKSKSATKLLLAAGIASALGDHTDAEAALTLAKPHCNSGNWSLAWVNQEAARLILAGKSEEARTLLSTESESPTLALNRGLLELTFGHRDEAEANLGFALSELEGKTAWLHLIQLYLAMTDSPKA